MRHRIGIVLAIVMAGLLFFAGSWGYLRLLRLPAPGRPAVRVCRLAVAPCSPSTVRLPR